MTAGAKTVALMTTTVTMTTMTPTVVTETMTKMETTTTVMMTKVVNATMITMRRAQRKRYDDDDDDDARRKTSHVCKVKEGRQCFFVSFFPSLRAWEPTRRRSSRSSAPEATKNWPTSKKCTEKVSAG